MLREYETSKEKVFLIRNLIEVRIPKRFYEKLASKYSKEYIISFSEPKKVLHHVTKRELVFVSKESGIPLLGHAAFGLIDRGTNLIQIRPITGCNLNCIFCSVDEGRKSKTKVTDYIVDPDYLADELKKIAEFKGIGVEAHIDGQGEPLLYPYMDMLLDKISKIKEVDVVSMQTNGVLLNAKKIEMLEKYVTRINLSLSTLDKKKAEIIHGVRYPLKRVIENAKMVAESKMDLLIAPVWVVGYNDDEIRKLIEFALEIGAGKKYPPLGIQKYIPYKTGRKLKNVMSFKEFYRKLKDLEKEYGIKLILKPEDFGMEKRRRIPDPIQKGERFKAKIVANGRMRGERLCVVRDRVVTVLTDRKVGDYVRFEVVRTHDGIFLGKEV